MAETRLPATSPQILGPFYPLGKSAKGGDLTRVAGRSGMAQGQVIHLGWRVLNRDGEPVHGANLEIWQANSHGRYTHPNDQHDAPLDDNFEGFAVIETDGNGTTDPAGIVEVNKGVPRDILAVPDNGYSFGIWEVVSVSNVVFGDQDSASTTVTLVRSGARSRPSGR